MGRDLRPFECECPGDTPGIQAKIIKRRTKSGCLTCRRRRIKCGEEKPACRNCAKTRRICEPPLMSSQPTKDRSVEQVDRVRKGSVPIMAPLVARSNTRSDLPRSYTQAYSMELSESPAMALTALSGSPLDASLMLTCSSNPSDCYSTYSTDPGFVTEPTLEQVPHTSVPAYSAILNQPQAEAGHMVKAPAFQHLSGGVLTTYVPDAVTDRKLLSTKPPLIPLGQSSVQHSVVLQPLVHLTEWQQVYLQYFIQHVHMNFSVLEESPYEEANIRASNLWTFVIPEMAVRSKVLMHCIVACALIHEACHTGQFRERALLQYHKATNEVTKTLCGSTILDHDSFMTSCLILAYLETSTGDMLEPGRHLRVGRDSMRSIIISRDLEQPHRRFAPCVNPTVTDHLIWYYIHQDVTHALMSGSSMMLDLRYVTLCPLRGAPGTITHTMDQLRLVLCRIAAFNAAAAAAACQDDDIQETDQAYLATEVTAWNELLAVLDAWQADLRPAFGSSQVAETMTPFGGIVVFQHPSIATIHLMSLTARLLLHKAHPMAYLPKSASGNVPSLTHAIEIDIIKILSGLMVEAVSNREIEHAVHAVALLDTALPFSLIAQTPCDAVQQEFIDRLTMEMSTFAGPAWRLDRHSCGRTVPAAESFLKANEQYYTTDQTPSESWSTYSGTSTAGIVDAQSNMYFPEQREQQFLAPPWDSVALMRPDLYGWSTTSKSTIAPSIY